MKYGEFTCRRYPANIEIFMDSVTSIVDGRELISGGRVLFMVCDGDTPYRGITDSGELMAHFENLSYRGKIAFIKREGEHDKYIESL